MLASEVQIDKIRDDLYCSMFENVIEDQILINYSHKVVTKESKLSVRSVTPFTRTQVDFLNGNQFFGDMNQCRMSGSGRYLWADDGSVYEGEFNRTNVIEGRGTFKFRNHEKSSGSIKYCGSFADGTYHGKGQITNYFFKFNGNFERGKFQGKGSLKSGIEAFDGWFESDSKVCGKRVYSDGIFTGDFRDDGTRNFGKYEFDNGDVYFGSFDDGMFSGHGEYTWSSTSDAEIKFIGNWHRSFRDGLGILKVDGSTCVTVFRKNVKDGPAAVWAKNGKIYASNRMFHRDEFLGCREIEVCPENIDTLRKLFDPKTFNSQNFKTLINDLVEKFATATDALVYPFHVSWFELKVEHSAIWSFVRDFPNTNREQEFNSMTQTVSEYASAFHELYYRYTAYSSKAVGRDCAGMLRVGLWQLMRDLELHTKSSLFNSQFILDEADRELSILSINSYDPFDVVSISSLVQYIIYITLHMNKHHDFVLSCALNQRSKIFGLFATMFVIFMREFLCPMMTRQHFLGTIPKLIQDDRTFFINFLRIIGHEHQKLSVRSVFKIVELWKSKQSKKRAGDAAIGE